MIPVDPRGDHITLRKPRASGDDPYMAIQKKIPEE